jgi:hypothetical protein
LTTPYKFGIILLQHPKERSAMSKAIILDRKTGKWTRAEQDALIGASVEFESHGKKPNRIVALNKPLSGATFEKVLGPRILYQKK